MERHARAENGAEHDFLINHLAIGVNPQRSTHFFSLVVECAADFIGHDFSYAFEVAAEAQRIFLDSDVAHLGQILAYERRTVGKIVNLHI